MMDLNKCKKCGLSLISEEILTHECKNVVDCKFEGQILWLFDGEIWYPRKLRATENLHGEDQPQNGQNLKTILL